MSDVDSAIEENPFTPPEDAAKVDSFLDRFKSIKEQGEKPAKERIRQALEEVDRQTSTDVVLTKLTSGQLTKDEAAKAIVNAQQSLADQAMAASRKLSEKEKEQKEIEEKLTRDGLTGLRNKVWFEKELAKRVADPKNNTDVSKLWLVYMDLDKFKDINSAYGHPIGDKIIQLMAQVKGEKEELSRIGGEEFALIVDLNDYITDDEDATDDAKLRTILEKYSIGSKTLSEDLLIDAKPGDHLSDNPEVVPPKRVSLSFGLTRYQSSDTPDALQDRASSAVLRAKNTGRDRAIASFPSSNELVYANLKIPG